MKRSSALLSLLFALVVAAMLAITVSGCRKAPEPVETKKQDATIKEATTTAEYSGILSDEQKKIIDTIGRPRQFILAYVPVESQVGTSLSRMEVWFYPDRGRKITFLGGLIFDTEK